MANRAGWRGLRRTLWALTFGLLSCSVGTSHEPAPSATKAPLDEARDWSSPPAIAPAALHPTAELVSDPALRAQVDLLATQTTRPPWVNPWGIVGPFPSTGGAMVGIDGNASSDWKTYQALATSIRSTDAVALLRHENPAVRLYASRLVLGALPRDQALEAVYPLFADTAKVETRNGCTGTVIAIGETLLERVEHLEGLSASERQSFLTMIGADERLPTRVRRNARADVAGITIEGRDDLDSEADLARNWAKFDAPSAAFDLEGLLDSSRASAVRIAAAEVYCAQSSADPKVLAKLKADADANVVQAAARCKASPPPRGVVVPGDERPVVLSGVGSTSARP